MTTGNDNNEFKEAVFVGDKNHFELRNYQLGPFPSPYHVKIKIKWVGICGSDLHSIETKFLPELSLGHEWIGEVVQIGSSVSLFKIGDIVTSTVQIRCGHCSACISRADVCEKQFSLAVGHGMLREVAYLPEASLIEVPGPHSSSSTLFEILAVAENVYIETANDLTPDKNILIIGAGLLGLSVALVLKNMGHNPTILEAIPSRLIRSQRLGITSLHLGEALIDNNCTDSYDVIYDTSGDHLGSKGGLRYLEHFGARKFKAVILAKYLAPMDLKTDRLFSKQASFKWIQGCTAESLRIAIQNWQSRIDELGTLLISHNYSFAEVNEAFAMAKKRDQAARVIICFNS